MNKLQSRNDCSAHMRHCSFDNFSSSQAQWPGEVPSIVLSLPEQKNEQPCAAAPLCRNNDDQRHTKDAFSCSSSSTANNVSPSWFDFSFGSSSSASFFLDTSLQTSVGEDTTDTNCQQGPELTITLNTTQSGEEEEDDISLLSFEHYPTASNHDEDYRHDPNSNCDDALRGWSGSRSICSTLHTTDDVDSPSHATAPPQPTPCSTAHALVVQPRLPHWEPYSYSLYLLPHSRFRLACNRAFGCALYLQSRSEVMHTLKGVFRAHPETILYLVPRENDTMLLRLDRSNYQTILSKRRHVEWDGAGSLTSVSLASSAQGRTVQAPPPPP